jgi:hypothetical protein
MSTITAERDAEKPHVETPHITMREIDLEHLGDVEENPQAVSFRVKLSEKPPEGWIIEFDEMYRQTPYTLKPPVEVKDGALEIIFLPRYSSDLQGLITFLGYIVRRANEELHRTEEMQVSNEQENRKTQFRETLRGIKLPADR